ncbi:MAG: membrane protein insertase YidC [Hyphomonadaceae bacterium]|nr:membrane protein insertase YidC [Hyphomonadaceae bacterium]MBC6411768.1 membrane protein insertase YidC [Hyphomonadaceae bacterium]
MEDQKNFLAAIALSTLVLIGYWYFVGRPMNEQAREQVRLEQEGAASAPRTPQVVLQPRDTVINSAQRIKIDTPSLSGSFRVRGSRFDDIKLKNYRQTLDRDSPNVIVSTPEGVEKAAYSFDNWVRGEGSGTETAWALVSGNTLTPDNPVVLQYEGEGFAVERTITVDDRYLITLADRVSNTGNTEISLVRRGASRQHGLPDDLTNFFILQEGPISIIDNRLFDRKYKSVVKKRIVEERGLSGWVGLTDKYWLMAAIAPQQRPMTVNFAYRNINDQEIYEATYALDPVTLTPGAAIESVGYVFAGAKDRDVLSSYEKNLGIAQMERAIDWGFLRILTRPMSWALSKMGAFFGNYGIAIMALTLIIKILLFPLFNKQYEMQAKMKKVQPKLKKIQGLYKDDPTRLRQEMMGLYRKENVNPAAGCLPIIPTIIIFFALYKTVFINVELRHAPFFGYIQDLSARDPLSVLNGFGLLPWTGVPENLLGFFAIGPLAFLYGATMAAMYLLTPPPSTGGEMAEIQAKIFKFMPWIFMFVLAPFAAGLLIYWVWNNVLSFAQQYYITRKFNVDTPFDAFFRRLRGKGEKAANG